MCKWHYKGQALLPGKMPRNFYGATMHFWNMHAGSNLCMLMLRGCAIRAWMQAAARTRQQHDTGAFIAVGSEVRECNAYQVICHIRNSQLIQAVHQPKLQAAWRARRT